MVLLGNGTVAQEVGTMVFAFCSFLGNDLKQLHWGSSKGPHLRLLVATRLSGARWCQ